MTSYNLYLNELVFKSRRYIIEMLNDRGCDTKSLENYTQDEMISLLDKHQQGKYEDAATLSPLDIKVKSKNEEALGTTIIKYRLDEKIKKDVITKQVTAIFEEHSLNKDTDCVIIMNINRVIQRPGAKDDSVVGLVNALYLKGMFVQIYGLENFMFNISKHVFVPKHTLLSPKEVTELKDRLNIELKHLPRIKREDPMAKYIGLRPGQVVYINAMSATIGCMPYYRQCE